MNFTSDFAAACLESFTKATRGLLIALLSILGICASLVLSHSAAADRRGPAAPAQAAKKDIAWHGCGKRLQCARVPVPLDWDRRRGPAIKLSVIRHLASRPGKRIGSLFVNPGGPGASGVALVREGGTALDALTQGRFDVVSWDIRGSGGSAGVSCFKSERRRTRFWDHRSIPTTRPGSRHYLPRTVTYSERCGAVNGGLLRHISTADTARDLDYLRRLVGDRKLTFYGASAGTLLGQTYANLFPGRVRAMVLDGVVDPVPWTTGAEPAIANLRRDTDRVFEKFESLCQRAGPTDCALAGKGPVAVRVKRLFHRLR
jgi:pimeloyl-ACP methyl ester carboxylesterase